MEKPIKFIPDYIKFETGTNKVSFDQMWVSAVSSSDAGWSIFKREYPNACPKCKMSDGLDEHQKCKYCEYDNSQKECKNFKKCKNTYAGESLTKPLCESCYEKDAAKKRRSWKKEQRRISRILEEERERERIAWRADVSMKKGKIIVDLDVDLDWYDYEQAEALPKELTKEQAIDLYNKLGKLIND